MWYLGIISGVFLFSETMWLVTKKKAFLLTVSSFSNTPQAKLVPSLFSCCNVVCVFVCVGFWVMYSKNTDLHSSSFNLSYILILRFCGSICIFVLLSAALSPRMNRIRACFIPYSPLPQVLFFQSLLWYLSRLEENGLGWQVRGI